MFVEAGHFAIILALTLALVQSVLPFWGARVGDLGLMRVGSSAALTLSTRNGQSSVLVSSTEPTAS